MACIISDPNGRKRIQFIDPLDRERKTWRMGKAPMREAEFAKSRTEQLVRFNAGALTMLDEDTIRWLSRLSDPMYERLASVGLVQPRVSTTLGAFLDGWLSGRQDLKPNSQLVYGHTRRTLVEFFGADKSLRSITEEDAGKWRDYLAEQGLAEATVNKRAANAKVFFRVAVKRKLIPSNPFADLESRSIANKGRQHFVTREDAQRVLDACPDAEWRLIFSLCRYAGLRCPSEVLALRWQDITWKPGRIHVTSPKTEHFEGRGSRDIPLFPELDKPLHDVFDQAEDGAEYVITRYRRANANLRTQLERILKRAGLEPWPRLFQNLRSSRETELASEYPLHVATYWIGNTARIAERHYLQVPDSLYEKAVQNAAHEVQKEAQQTSAMVRSGVHENPPEGHENADLAISAAQTWSAESDGWRRRESNPHSGDATAVCSRYTTSPGTIFTVFYGLSAESQRSFEFFHENHLR